MDLTALHSFLKTKKEASKLTILFEGLNNALFKDNFNLKEVLSKSTSYDLSLQIEKVLENSNINKDDKNALKDFCQKLQAEILDLPVIHMILAFSPSEEMVAMIHDWFYANFKKIVLLDITVDKSIIAGAVISFKGRANDYSIATKISQIV